MKHWYALAVETRWETHVKAALDAKGHTAYLAIEEIRMPSRGRGPVVPVRRPFIFGYVFVMLGDPQRADGEIEDVRLRGTASARPLVRGASPWPTPMQPGIIETLRKLEDADGVIRPKGALAKLLGQEFDPNQKVRLVGDCEFTGYLARVIAMRGAARVKLFVNETFYTTVSIADVVGA